MVKTRTTKLVKGSASSKELNMQLQRAQNRAMEQSKTGSPKPPKQSTQRSKKLSKWTPKDMEGAVNMYRNSRALGHKGKPVSDSVCRLISFSGLPYEKPDHHTIDLFLYCSYQ